MYYTQAILLHWRDRYVPEFDHIKNDTNKLYLQWSFALYKILLDSPFIKIIYLSSSWLQLQRVEEILPNKMYLQFTSTKSGSGWWNGTKHWKQLYTILNFMSTK